jgi:ADP-ribose pyrophosphatase
MPFELVHSETVYEGRAVSIRRDEVRLPDGKTTRLEIVEHVGSVVIVPLDEQGRIYFVRQYRHATGQEMLELPAGTLRSGEDPLACAAREIREETGMAAEHLRELGGFYLAPGYSTEYMRVFLATGLSESPLDQDEDEFVEPVIIPAAEGLELARGSKIADAKSLAALLLAESVISSQ